MVKGCLLFIVLAFAVQAVFASSIYTDQINFEPGSSRAHSQEIELDSTGNITVITDPAFTVTGSIPAAATAGDNISWTSESSVTFTMTSPANCTEGDVYRMPVYIDSSLFSSFTFICVPDNKVVDYKGEYGHGDSNYLSDSYRYLPAESDISLFNLIRVFTYGSYLNPNENGLNATITCTFPDYLVRTRQMNEGTEVTHSSTGTVAKFHWTNLFGNWFRVAPLEQEINNLSIGANYNITCDELTYYYTTGRIKASFDNVSYTAVSTAPLNITAAVVNSSKALIYTIKNDQVYPVYDLEFLWKTANGDAVREEIKELQPNETVSYEVFLEGTGTLSLDASFVPSWQHLSLKPTRYSQAFADAFVFTNGTGSIKRIEEAQNVPRITLTHYNLIQADQDYVATLIFEVNGVPTAPDSIPTYKLIDSNGSIVVNLTSMALVSTGVYNFTYDVSVSDTVGIWRTETYTIYNGNTIPRIDYWTLQSNPTQLDVEVISRCEDSICADISIQNEGESSFEYVYSWWITDDAAEDFNGPNVTDKGQASKLIQPGDTYIITQCLTQPNASVPGTHYFRAKTYYGEFSFATDSFDSSQSCRQLNNGGGGAGGFNERTIPAAEGLEIVNVTANVIPFLIAMFILFFLMRRRKRTREHRNAPPDTRHTSRWAPYTTGKQNKRGK